MLMSGIDVVTNVAAAAIDLRYVAAVQQSEVHKVCVCLLRSNFFCVVVMVTQ